ncbi:hypothetical protein L484_015407 [Morus notabilis]|uniref:Uncharacterized protein n=1 Tax=Morus notabilis TaxID=981085 RepID=W9RRE5_9ROSA|nr:hypothetical protein L484_015407 [Morus notabilis]
MRAIVIRKQIQKSRAACRQSQPTKRQRPPSEPPTTLVTFTELKESAKLLQKPGGEKFSENVTSQLELKTRIREVNEA